MPNARRTAAMTLHASAAITLALAGAAAQAQESVRAVRPGQPAAADTPAAQQARAAAAATLAAHPLVRQLQASPVPANMGAVGRRTEPGMMAFTVARRQADGSLGTVCVTGDQAAVQAMSRAPLATAREAGHAN